MVGPSAAAQSSYFGQIEGGKERGSGKKSGAVAEIWPLAKTLLCCTARDISSLGSPTLFYGRQGGWEKDIMVFSIFVLFQL